MKKETQQDNILAMHEDGFTPREMFHELKQLNKMVSIGSVYATLAKFGLKPNQKRCPSCGTHLSPTRATP
jgi:uncharacterized protein with PIN domain